MTRLVGTVNLLAVPFRLFDLGGIEQRRDDCGGTDADGDTRFYQLGPALIVAIAHSILSLDYQVRSYSERRKLGSAEALCAVA